MNLAKKNVEKLKWWPKILSFKRRSYCNEQLKKGFELKNKGYIQYLSEIIKNTINIFGFSGGVNTTFDASSNSFIQNYGGDEIGGDVNVSIGEQNYSFPVTEHKQVILIRQKYVEDEVFVDVRWKTKKL